tara:strand:+ start:2619 stop:2909 length:291 start_codon:yes stop_codon:yes gene_type:complete
MIDYDHIQDYCNQKEEPLDHNKLKKDSMASSLMKLDGLIRDYMLRLDQSVLGIKTFEETDKQDLDLKIKDLQSYIVDNSSWTKEALDYRILQLHFK